MLACVTAWLYFATMPKHEAQANAVTADCRNETDCTAELQAALDTCAATVEVPALSGGRTWDVRPITVTCDGQTIHFAAAAVLQASGHTQFYWKFQRSSVDLILYLE